MLDPKRTRPNVNDTKDGLDLSLFCVQIVIVYSGLVQDGRSCAKGLRRKVWTRTKILSSNIYAILLRYYDLSRFAHFLEDFFLVKNNVLGQEVLCSI